MGFVVDFSICVIKVGVFVYDILTYPIYALYVQPWRAYKNGKKQAVIVPSSEGISYHTTRETTDFQVELKRNNIDNVQKLFSFSCKKYSNKKGFGTRKVIKEFKEKQSNGKIFIKYELGEYSWMTYHEANELATHFGSGLRAIGHQPKESILIFAETRVEWILSAMGAFKQNIPIATLYATLGEEALIYGLNEIETRHVVVSHDLIPKIRKILHKCPKIEKIIYLPDQLNPTDTSGFENIELISFQDMIEKGKANPIPDVETGSDDTAVIMYTSGSTGAPKGVIMSHHNLSYAISSFSAFIVPIEEDLYLSYLPLAHVLELMGEIIMITFGIPLAYSSPLTMTDRSTKVKRGCLGDVSVARPTIIPSVPLILDRIYKGILEKVNSRGLYLTSLFEFGVAYKMKWSERGFPTPIADWVVFRKIRALLGGRVRVMVVGGAPLAPETHRFVRAALRSIVIQGYGLTETCGCATLMDLKDQSTNRVGSPLSSSDIKLVDWDEGNYRITDKPNPRGEVVIGGENVTMGYFKNEEKTRSEYYEMDGRRWFKTGDIGQMDADGVLRIIDRKKDLVKLQFGEYISLGKVEAELKVSPLTENLCVYADPTKNHVVVIVSPKVDNLRKLAQQIGVDDTLPLDQLCKDNTLKKAVLQELATTGKKANLERFELPAAIYMTSEPWTPDSGLVTAAFKLRRRQIQDKYQHAIDRMYGA